MYRITGLFVLNVIVTNSACPSGLSCVSDITTTFKAIYNHYSCVMCNSISYDVFVDICIFLQVIKILVKT